MTEFTTDLHHCDGNLPEWETYGFSGFYGAAINQCREDSHHRLWVDNGEYASQVNFCPYCGYRAKNRTSREGYDHRALGSEETEKTAKILVPREATDEMVKHVMVCNMVRSEILNALTHEELRDLWRHMARMGAGLVPR